MYARMREEQTFLPGAGLMYSLCNMEILSGKPV